MSALAQPPFFFVHNMKTGGASLRPGLQRAHTPPYREYRMARRLLML